jgi:hypothetical protein
VSRHGITASILFIRNVTFLVGDAGFAMITDPTMLRLAERVPVQDRPEVVWRAVVAGYRDV